jgi:long-chain fatty acid transport protein
MKKIITLSIAALALTQSAYATNGTNLIGYGAQSRAMGGTGVAMYQGAETAFNNPALIGKGTKNVEISIGGTLFTPSVSYEDGFSGTSDSDTGTSIIPAISVINKINKDVSIGVAMYGTAGMGVDYRDSSNAAISAQNNNMMNMRLSVPVSYQVINGLTLGLAPVIEYGSLSMNGVGVTNDLAYGYELGAAYTYATATVGIDYKSAIEHDYGNTFNSDFTGGTQSTLGTPAVLALGVSNDFRIAEGRTMTLSADYKRIFNSSAAGFDDFGWEDQNVYGVGIQCQNENTGISLRAGYNYGAQPLAEFTDNPNGSLGSYMAFPAVTEHHFTLGGSYAVNDVTSIDLAYVYGMGSASQDVNYGGPGMDTTIETINDQNSFSVALNYGF